MDHGWFGNLPKLTSLMIRQNSPVSRATAMGYLDQSRQGQHSTRGKQASKNRRRPTSPTASPEPVDTLHSHILDDLDTSNLCFQVLSVEDFMNSSDATCEFPFPTLSGFNYILVSALKGYVHFELMRSRFASEYVRVYKAMYAFYDNLNKTPTIQRLDNETSNELQTFLREAKVKYELVAPGIHR